MNWMDELADETFDKSFKAAMKAQEDYLVKKNKMRNEFRKDKIKRLFNL